MSKLYQTEHLLFPLLISHVMILQTDLIAVIANVNAV